jgi:hypothetical protein
MLATEISREKIAEHERRRNCRGIIAFVALHDAGGWSDARSPSTSLRAGFRSA